MPEPPVMTSAAAEYNEAYITCMVISYIHMNLNHIEEVEDESKENIHHLTFTWILPYIISDVDIIITFKDTNNARHMRCRLDFFCTTSSIGTTPPCLNHHSITNGR
jgi:hypothetical protein